MSKRENVMIRASHEILYGDVIKLYGFVDVAGSSREVFDEISTREVEDYERTSHFCAIEMGAAQRLMDDLWNCGLRPTEGRGSAGQLEAVQRHLDDMKKIAFDLLENINAKVTPRSIEETGGQKEP